MAARVTRPLWLVVVCLVFGLLAGQAAASSFTADPIVQVSGLSPFSSCTLDNIGTQSGFLYPDSEVEPWVAVNLTNSSNVVGIWQQDRWSNGGARGLVAGVSNNGGANYTTVVIPKITLCSGGTSANGGGYQRSTDPWVTFGPNGVVYQLALSFNDFDFDHALLASKSADGGQTWSDPVVVRRDTLPTVFNDKQSITADPSNPNLVYAVWDRLVFPNEHANVKAAFHAHASRGPVWFSRSTNGGVTWEPARPIYDPGQNSQTLANQIVVLSNGTLVNLLNIIHNENKQGLRGNNVAVMFSTDNGVTWSQPRVIAHLGTITVTDPETGAPVRTGDILPEIAVDPNPTSGALYVVWQDARFSGGQNDSIAFSQSADGGQTWSSPIKVNLTPTNLPAGNQQAFTPSVHVAADGTVGVTYYDFRNNTSDATTLLTDYFIVHCHPSAAGGCASAANWGNEVKLTDVSFNMAATPFALGYFTGDYEGLSAIGTDFLAVFSQEHGADPASIFSRRVGP